MAIKGMKQTLFKSIGWFLVLIGLMLGIFSCYQIFAFPSDYGFALGVTFVTIVVSLILVSIDLPNLKIKNISIKTVKNLIFVLFAVIDVLFLALYQPGAFSVQALVLFIGMVLAAIVFKLEKDFIEKRKKKLGLVSLLIEVVLALIVGLAIPNANNWLFPLFLIYGIGGMVGWDTLQSIFWKQKLRSIIFLSISIVIGWIYGIVLVTMLWTNILGPIFVTLGVFLVLYLEWQMRKKKLLIYIK